MLKSKKNKKVIYLFISIIAIIVIIIATYKIIENKKYNERKDYVISEYESVYDDEDMMHFDWKFDFDNKDYEELQEGNFYYLINRENEAVITYYKGNEKDIVIPDTLGKHKVTMIYHDAFKKSKHIENLTIPKNIEIIGIDAFSECPNLKRINIENGVNTIGDMAFCGNEKLKSINIPNSIENYGTFVFGGNFSLTDVKFEEDLTKIADSIFLNCKSLENITIPHSVKTIETLALSGTNIKNLDIPQGVETIGDEVFSNCNNLESITIPKSVKKIGDNLFYKCKNKVVIYGEKGSYAEIYAKDKGIEFKEIER